MPANKANCLICGEPLAYFEEAQEVKCAVCGARETGHSVCVAGHYVCDACHRARGVDCAIERCLASASADPIALAIEIMRDRSIYPNGPEHHTLAGAALLTAYRNSGGEVDLEKGLAELRERSMQVPGGTCGFWGVCGAAASAGQFWSIVSGSTPMKPEPWAECQELTSRILGRLARLGGPRCCKRTGFTAVLEGAAFAKEKRGVEMKLPAKVRCPFFPRNAECLKERCPYYPQA